MENRSSGTVVVVIVVLLVVCLCCICIASIGLVAGTSYLGVSRTLAPLLTNSPLNPEITPTPLPWPTPRSQPTPGAGDPALEAMARQSLQALDDTIIPINDPVHLADRLGGKQNVPETFPDPLAPYSEGARKSFWVTNTDNNQNFQVTAALRYRGENIYVWIQEGVDYRDSQLQTMAATFDQKIIPTNREFFGMEWNPGVDNDPRLFILYAGGVGRNIAGYFSSADEVHPDAHPYSNAHEMFIINSDNVGLGENYIYGTLAHEFQHMIHWYQDKNEETWLNEGFSMLAEHINEYDAGGFEYAYLYDTDLQLNDWKGGNQDNTAHYGASYIFMVYFLDRFGEEATKALVAHKENGFTAIDMVMKELDLRDPNTGELYTGVQIFSDWAVTNILRDRNLQNGRYDYKSYDPIRASITKLATHCPTSLQGDVYQYGVHNIEIDCPGTYTLSFEGTPFVNLLPFSGPSSGEYFFWSNAADESNPTLTQTFDLTGLQGPISLDFKVWYDLEADYDYVFVSASTDGEGWEILNSRNCTSEDPSGNSYGCGWNGVSGTWLQESVDISAYAGSKVTLRFDYVTDAAVNGKGMALDDFSITALNYQSDLEKDDGGWETDGFVRLQNSLPQSYSLSFVRMGSKASVVPLELDDQNKLSYEFTLEEGDEPAVLIISGTTLYTREKALYRISID